MTEVAQHGGEARFWDAPAIRPATADDAAQIAALLLPVVRDTTITFLSTPKTAPDIVADLDAKAKAGHAMFVAVAGDQVMGMAGYGQFRGGNGYAHAYEHSIVLAPEARGHGVGRMLMDRLQEHAQASGGHTLWAGVSGENPAGVAFHARLGFEQIAVLPEVGRKFDRWLDLVLMRKIL